MNGKKLKVLELFAGTRSIGKAFEAKGHEVFSVEWDKDFENIDLYADILNVSAEEIISKFGHPDVIWASPDCTTFSIAAISHHRKRNPDTGNLDPVSDYAKFCDKVDQHVLQLIKDLDPALYFIENPRGGMRKMVCKVDFTAWNERRERAKRMNELQCMMNNRVRDLQETALFEMLASKDPELKAMLDEYKTLRGC